MIVVQHWSAPPLVILGLVVVGVLHAVGVRRTGGSGSLAQRSARDRGRRQQAWLFRLGLLGIFVALASPIDYWSDIEFWPHMIQHLILIFVCGPLIVLGAPWLPLTRGLPAGARRWLLRALFVSRGGQRLRAVGRALGYPPVIAGVFILTLYAWHVPAAFDLTLRNQAVHDVEHLCFLAIGVLFWGQLVGSYPFSPRWPPLKRAGIAAAVMFGSWFLSIGMAFAAHPWYPAYGAVTAPHMPLLADQQLAAAIMWVIPMFPTGIIVGWLVNQFITEDADDEGRLQQLIADTRAELYGGIETP